MSNLINLYVHPSDIKNCLEQADVSGKKLYNQNENYRNLVNCLEHPEFRKFFDTYFSDENEIKVILMFMKLYNKIEKSSPVELNGYQKISILDNLMKNRDFRRRICEQSTNDMKLMDI